MPSMNLLQHFLSGWLACSVQGDDEEDDEKVNPTQLIQQNNNNALITKRELLGKATSPRVPHNNGMILMRQNSFKRDLDHLPQETRHSKLLHIQEQQQGISLTTRYQV